MGIPSNYGISPIPRAYFLALCYAREDYAGCWPTRSGAAAAYCSHAEHAFFRQWIDHTEAMHILDEGPALETKWSEYFSALDCLLDAIEYHGNPAELRYLEAYEGCCNAATTTLRYHNLPLPSWNLPPANDFVNLWMWRDSTQGPHMARWYQKYAAGYLYRTLRFPFERKSVEGSSGGHPPRVVPPTSVTVQSQPTPLPRSPAATVSRTVTRNGSSGNWRTASSSSSHSPRVVTPTTFQSLLAPQARSPAETVSRVSSWDGSSRGGRTPPSSPR
ncbi:hypothetical protein JCM10908_000490 [Rhodotorula pacifica]|uniref:uncharacterized protein n=1 Tax=Rhodotorula pacifica TaxID=1495444 RepID=UPI0031795DB3